MLSSRTWGIFLIGCVAGFLMLVQVFHESGHSTATAVLMFGVCVAVALGTVKARCGRIF